MQAYPALPAFAFALTALFLKTTLTTLLQIAARFRTLSFILPEDAAMMRMRPKEEEAPLVQRCAGIWRNDLENLPLFLALAFAYVLAGAPAATAAWLFGAYVVLRYLHTLAYLFRLQPWRALAFFGGLGICWTIAVKLLLQLFA